MNSDIENHKIGDVNAGTAKSNVIPTHINRVAIHTGIDPSLEVDEANRPKRGSWKKSIDLKNNNASPREHKLISYL